MPNDRIIFICAASLFTLVVGYIGYAALTTKKYVRRSKIMKLLIYPIKSLPGVEVDHLEIMPSYCRYRNFRDRSWILLDDANRMITLRSEPKMAKIQITLLEDTIRLQAEGMPSIEVPVDQPLKKGDRIHTVNIHGRDVDGQECGDEINRWFSRYLGQECKLIRHHDKLGFSGKNQDILYQDGAPVLMINETSVQDLNLRIENDHGDERRPKVKSDQFRPNVLFETDKPYEEDTWKFVKINDSEFEFLVECPRCKASTFNKTTWEYEAEPLRTLKKYRMAPVEIFFGSPKMGVYMNPVRAGSIHVGDEVFAVW